MKFIVKSSSTTGILISIFLFSTVLSLLATTTRLPRFMDYPIASVYRGKTHVLLSKYKDAIEKSDIPDAAQRKADFAGHYVVVQGGCGTGCTSLGAMDAKTGEICWFRHTLIEDAVSDLPRVRYQLTSRLLILHCYLDEDRDTNGTYYYVLKANRFERLRYIHTKYHDPTLGTGK